MKNSASRLFGTLFLSIFGTSLFTALLIYVLEIIFVVAFTALIYSGELTSEIPRALGFIIIGDAVLCAVVAWLSSYPGAIAVEQDTPGVILGVIAVGMTAGLSGLVPRQFATVTMMIVITSLMTGFLLAILGIFKLGGLARFLPYPVMGGFLAGTGWLLVQGGIGMMANAEIGPEWFQWHAIELWAPGLLLGIVVYMQAQKRKNPYTIPLLMLASSVLFFIVARAMGVSVSQLRADGWLLDSHASTTRWEFALNPSLIAQADWGLLFDEFPALLSVAIISVIALLLGSSGMELIIKKDIDLNRELIIAGMGNVAAGMLGGLVGFQDISFSTLNYVMSGGRRLVGLLVALLIGATLIMGTSAILYIPKFVLGSVLIYLGIELLIEWVYEAWFRLSRIDFFMVVSILVTLAVWGVLAGVIIGLILAVLMFIVSYSRVSVIRFALTGREYRSRVTRAPDEQMVLEVHGNQLYIMKLEGFIFFGTANGIFERLRDYINTMGANEVKYILLDFSKVTGIDSTGMLSFVRMMQWSQEQKITLALTGLGKEFQKQFLQESSALTEGPPQFFPDADHGIEWCENEIIASNLADLQREKDISELLKSILKEENVGKLIPYLKCHEYHSGEYLIREGDPADRMYFVQSGQVTVQLETPGKFPVRLETVNPGRTVGELGFFLGTRRAASVVANRDSVVYALSVTDLEQMERIDPEAANLFHRLSVILLSERVMHNTYMVRALERS